MANCTRAQQQKLREHFLNYKYDFFRSNEIISTHLNKKQLYHQQKLCRSFFLRVILYTLLRTDVQIYDFLISKEESMRCNSS